MSAGTVDANFSPVKVELLFREGAMRRRHNPGRYQEEPNRPKFVFVFRFPFCIVVGLFLMRNAVALLSIFAAGARVTFTSGSKILRSPASREHLYLYKSLEDSFKYFTSKF